MRPARRSGMGNLLSMLALAVSFAAAAIPVSAQYPTKPIRIIVPFAAGGTTDILSRAVGAKLAAVLGQPVIADNRPGASGVIGSEIVAKASPDGYTIGMLISTHAVNPFVIKSLPYDTINDFTPITLVAIVPGILSANASLPVRSVQEMVQLVRSKPGQFNYGLPGSMTSGHLSMELLKVIAGLDMVAVSYKGGAPAAADLAAGQVQFMINSPPTVLPFVKAGKVRALAVTGAQRLPALPDLPTSRYWCFPAYETDEWWGPLGAQFMYRGTAILGVAFAVLAAAPISAQSGERVNPIAPSGTPPGLAARAVEEMYFGTKVIDPFRFMEAMDPKTIAWIKAQGAYTRSVFDSIAPRAQYLRTLSAFSASFGFVRSAQVTRNHIFYLERKPGSDVYDLVVRASGGQTHTLVDTKALIKAAGGVPQAIDYFTASRDGKRVAVGISAGGSEASVLTVLDTATAATVAGPIDRAQWSQPSWTDNGSGLFLGRLQERRPGAAPTDKYLNSSSSYWDLNGPPVPMAGAATGLGPIKDPVVFAVRLVVRAVSRPLS